MFLMGGSAVRAEDPGSLRVNIPFKFYFDTTELGPGEYLISNSTTRSPFITLRAVKETKTHQAVIVTRLAGSGSQPRSPKLVFDTVGENKYISEVWLPGKDGFLVRGTPEEHKHQTLSATASSSQ